MASINDILSSKPEETQGDAVPEDQAPSDGAVMEMDEPTPEEQDMYDDVVTAGIKLVNTTSKQMAKMAAQSEDPATDIAKFTLDIMANIIARSPEKISEEILLGSIDEIVEKVAEVFDAVENVTEKQFMDALSNSMIGLADHLGVEISQEEIVSLVNQMSEEELQELKTLREGDQPDGDDR